MLTLAAAAQLALAFGPLENPGFAPVADARGAWCPGFSFTPLGAKPEPWQARWIGLSADPPVAMLLRKQFDLPAAPAKVLAYVSGDVRYRLWINGRLAVRGPVDQGHDYDRGKTERYFYDVRDLTPFFQAGTNTVAAEVFKRWPRGPQDSRGRAGLLFEATAKLPDGTSRTLATDSTWRAVAAPSWPGRGFLYDAAAEPANWRLAGFDDGAWPLAKELPDLWQKLVASEIPALMEVRYPVTRLEHASGKVTLPEPDAQDRRVQVTGDGKFTVVFDRVLSAQPTITVRGGAGATVTLAAHSAASCLLGPETTVFEMPYMEEVVPSFTVEFKNVKTPLTVESVGAIFTCQPVDYRGAFKCNDEGLNRVWDASRWTVQICQQTHHLDSPNHQEPICDPGDYQIEAMVNYYAFAQPWLARQDLRKFGWLLENEKFHNFHTSYSLYWLQMLLDYYEFTGDRQLVEELAPTVHGLLDTYATWIGKNGLISEAPNYMFMDWVTIAGFGCHHPPAVIGQGYLTALYCHGLEQGARIAKLMGDTARVEKYGQLRATTAAAFNRELWVADRGLYRDGKPHVTSVKPYQWLPADKDIETFSPHVNLLAVLYDLAPRERQRAIVDEVLARPPLNTQPWFMHWVFMAIDHAGAFDTYGTAQMRRWQLNVPTHSFREMWNGGDLSHGWCSTPLVQLSGRVLGVSPAEPGFGRVRVAPQTCDLTQAEGRVPTPRGDVSVAWRYGEDRFELDLTLPPGTTGDLVPPLARFEQPTVTVDGAAPAGPLAAGTHKLVVTGKLKPLPPPLPEPVPVSRTLAGSSPLVTAQVSDQVGDAFEAQVIKDDLLHEGPHKALRRVEEQASHAGGGQDASALFNGTTRNADGGGDTRDDGRTFRGFGDDNSLTLYLDTAAAPRGYDLTELRSFAGHADARASQRYRVLLALAGAPRTFVPLADVDVPCNGGSTYVRTANKAGGVLDDGHGRRASGVVAVRFEFASGPVGFNVYREMCLLGNPTP